MTRYQIMYGPSHLLNDGTFGRLITTMVPPMTLDTAEEAKAAVDKAAVFPYDKEEFEVVEFEINPEYII